MAKKRFFQKVKEITVSKDSSHTENSSYWEYNQTRASGGERKEHPLANPDALAEMEIASPSTPQLLLGEAIQHLQGRQREVYLLTMREDKSLGEVAEILNISKSAAQVYKDRAIKFLVQYCRSAMAKGRV